MKNDILKLFLGYFPSDAVAVSYSKEARVVC